MTTDTTASQTIVLIGAQGLLGSTISQHLYQTGHHLICADRLEPPTAPCTLPQGPRLAYHPVDITQRDSIEQLITYSHARAGRIDAVINTAYPRNADYGKPFFEVSYASFCDNVAQHLGGYFLVCQRFCAYFKQQGFGNLINLSSVYAHTPPRFELYQDTQMTMPVEYAAIKAGLNQLTRYIARCLQGHRVRINTLSPGGIWQQQPQSFVSAYQQYCLNQGMLNAQDILSAIDFLLDPRSQCVNGQDILVDDGFSL